MTTAQVVETSVTVNNSSPIQDYVHPDDQTQPFEMTSGFKPFTIIFKFRNRGVAGIFEGGGGRRVDTVSNPEYLSVLTSLACRYPGRVLLKATFFFADEQ